MSQSSKQIHLQSRQSLGNLNLLNLPPEVLLLILNQLQIEDIVSCAQVSHRLRSLCLALSDSVQSCTTVSFEILLRKIDCFNRFHHKRQEWHNSSNGSTPSSTAITRTTGSDNRNLDNSGHEKLPLHDVWKVTGFSGNPFKHPKLLQLSSHRSMEYIFDLRLSFHFDALRIINLVDRLKPGHGRNNRELVRQAFYRITAKDYDAESRDFYNPPHRKSGWKRSISL